MVKIHSRKPFWVLAILSITIGVSCTKKQGAANTAESKGIFKQRMLVGVEIISLELVKIPRYGKDGERWDSWAPLSAEPDVYIKMSQYKRPVYTSEVKEEYAADTKMSFQKGIPFTLSAYAEKVLVEVFDEDGLTEDDNIGYLTWYPLDNQNKETVLLTTEDKNTVLQLGLRWVYEP
jgi:hypothetical protein